MPAIVREIQPPTLEELLTCPGAVAVERESIGGEEHYVVRYGRAGDRDALFAMIPASQVPEPVRDAFLAFMQGFYPVALEALGFGPVGG